MTRKLARVMISKELFTYLVTTGSYGHFECVRGVPDGSALVSVTFDPLTLCAVFVFSHESFSEVQESQVIPEIITEYAVKS